MSNTADQIREELFKELTVEQAAAVTALANDLRQFVRRSPLATLAFAIVGAELTEQAQDV